MPDAQAQEKVTAQSSPAPAVQTPEKAPEQSLAAATETREKTPEHSPVQQTASAQLRAALDAPADPSCFQYMPEPGTVTDFWNNPKPERALQKLVGKGLRITAYTGFDAERVVIPAKIGGQPVVSIGEKAFKNTTVSEVILPGSIKAILRGAFSGCKRLQHIDLPDGLEYLGSHCFASSGLTALHFPDRLKTIPEGCCGGCANLSDVTFGQQVQTIQWSAFHACKKLQTVSFPESLLRVDNDAFEKTAITRFIFRPVCKRSEMSSIVVSILSRATQHSIVQYRTALFWFPRNGCGSQNNRSYPYCAYLLPAGQQGTADRTG